MHSHLTKVRAPAVTALVLGFLHFTGRLLAGQVTLAWDPNTEPDLAGYRLYYGTSAGLHDRVVDVGNVTTNTVSDLDANTTYWFVATAYNFAGLESDPSNEIQYTVPPAPNAPPAIGQVADQTVPEDQTLGPVPFMVSDPDDDASTLVITATSSNPALVPDTQIALAGSDANRTVSVAPNPNATGSTTITLTVSDGQATATTSFTVTVSPVNDPPTIGALTDQTVPKNTTLDPVPFTVSDPDDPASTLTITATSSNPALVPDTQIALGGSDANRTVSVTPVADASGRATITLTVSDGQATAATSFALVVLDCLPPPWVAQDIGAPTLKGTACFQQTTVAVAGSGTDIGGTTDQFHFVWQPLSNSGEIKARVTSVQATDSWAKAGVMIRETLNGNSRHALMCVTPGNGFSFLRRTSTGGSTVSTAGGSLFPAPGNWVRLARSGNTIRAYKSADGTTWTQVGANLKIAWAAEIHVGLAVTARNGAQTCTAIFDTVAVVP